METNFNFKSAICTSRSQSERLLALGLKKETRDAVLKKYIHNDKYCYKPVFEDIEDRLIDCNDLYPAWSLHRLLSLYNLHYIEFMNDEEIESVYDIVIDAIEQAIKEGYFPKEYLCEK